MGRKGISLDELRQQRGFKSPEDSPPKKKLQQQRNFQSQRNSQQQRNPARQATAPYNFVSLPEKVLPAQFNGVDGFKEHLGSSGNISGEVLLDIEALTPLFFGGSGTSKSFSPVGTPIIPGSSLRGMFKNIFKIVTCGAFRGQTASQGKGEDFNDEHIYFRALMGVGRYPWTKDLNKLYNGRMTHSAKGKDGKLHPVKNARPGFLICTTDNKYFIAPSIYKSDRKEDRILIREYEEKFHARIDERNSSCVEWHDGTAYIIRRRELQKIEGRRQEKSRQAVYSIYQTRLRRLEPRSLD